MLFIYVLLIAATGIWVSGKQALVCGLLWFAGLAGVGIFVPAGESEAAGLVFNVYQGILVLYMAIAIAARQAWKPSRTASSHSEYDDAFPSSPRDRDDPRSRSKHVTGGEDSRRADGNENDA